MTFKNENHRTRFLKVIENVDKKDRVIVATVYLLTADPKLWAISRAALEGGEIYWKRIPVTRCNSNTYTLLFIARDLYMDTGLVTLRDIADPDVVSGKLFPIVYTALTIARSGLKSLKDATAEIESIEGGQIC